MSTDQIKIFVRRFETMFNKPDVRIADEIFAPCFVAHFPVTPRLNRSNFKGFIDSFYDAFPDFRLEINDTVVTNDRLVLRVTYYGTHDGDFMGIPATGREVTMHGMTIFRIQDGIAYESWTEIDLFGVVQQISAEPFSSLVVYIIIA